MLRWISILGGLLLMMGRHDRSEALFNGKKWKPSSRN